MAFIKNVHLCISSYLIKVSRSAFTAALYNNSLSKKIIYGMFYLYRQLFSVLPRSLALAAAIAVLCLPCGRSAMAAENKPVTRLPAYVVVLPSETRDNYILTQLFYAAFDADDIELVQQVVRQGLLSAPKDFPLVMALTLELLKKPDSRLFMLLSPISAHIANPGKPADISAMAHMANLLSGRILPGGARLDAHPELLEARDRQLLRTRIRFYTEDEQPQAVQDEEQSPEPAQPETGADKESLVFERKAAQTQDEPPASTLTWSRALLPGQRIISTASDAHMEDGSTWGEVRIITYDMPVAHTQSAFFAVRDGIITFAQPRGLTEADFYADEKTRVHYLKEFEEEMHVVRPDGSVPQPCRMEIQTTPMDDNWPPELGVLLQQTNPGLAHSNFLCRAQCRLTYTWDGEEYAITGKYCAGDGQWGVWPYSPERYEEITGRSAAGPSGR